MNNNQFLDDILNEIIDAADKVFEDEDLIAEDINEEDEESEKARAEEFFKEDDKEQQVDEGNKVTAYLLFMSEDELDDGPIDESNIKVIHVNGKLHSEAPYPPFSKKKINEKNFSDGFRHKYADCYIENGTGYVEWESLEDEYHDDEWEKEIKRAFAANGLPENAIIYCKFGSRDTGYVEEFELQIDSNDVDLNEGDTSTMEGNDPLFMEYFGHA